MDVLKLIKFAFVVATLLYAVVAISAVGRPDWGRPLLPDQPNAPLFYGFLFTLALVDWVGGFLVGGLAEMPAALRNVPSRSWPQTRLVIAAALVESGAIFGLVLAFLFKDSRVALVACGISAALLLMTPASGGSQEPA